SDTASVQPIPLYRGAFPMKTISHSRRLRQKIELLLPEMAEVSLADADPVAAALAPYFEHHAKKEDHDHWALEDREVPGVSRAERCSGCPPRRWPRWSVLSITGCCTTTPSRCWGRGWSARATRPASSRSTC